MWHWRCDTAAAEGRRSARAHKTPGMIEPTDSTDIGFDVVRINPPVCAAPLVTAATAATISVAPPLLVASASSVSASAIICVDRGSYTAAQCSAAAMLVINFRRKYRARIERQLNLRVNRIQLIDRLHLEVELSRGLLVLVFNILLFGAVIGLMLGTAGSGEELGLKHTYTETLGLGHLPGIRTSSSLKDYMRDLGRRAQSILPSSEIFFKEDEGEMRVVSGLSNYEAIEYITIKELRPKVDGRAFTLTAWKETQQRASVGTYVVRKPLEADNALSCWGWHIGAAPRLDFGAHDFSPTFGQTVRQESVGLTYDDGILADGSHRWISETRQMHFEAIVVNRTAVSFYQDAVLIATQPLRRPVTDCESIALEAGAPGMRLGDITIYPRR